MSKIDILMIEKIEITQRFNFKRLNRHYECFTIDMVNNNAYYKMLPYVVTMVVLAFTSKRSKAPKAEGIPYDKGQR